MRNKFWCKSNILMFCFLVFVLAFDLTTKYVVESKLSLGQEAAFLPGFMNFVVVHNNGAAWNLFAGFGIFLIVVTFIFLLVFLWYFFTKKSNSALLGIASGLVLGGCLGNLYDRIAFGYVRDFLNFQFMRFPVFNIADSALTVGIILLAIYFVFIYTKESKKDRERLEKIYGQPEDIKISTEDLDKRKPANISIKNSINVRTVVKSNAKKAKKKDKND